VSGVNRFADEPHSSPGSSSALHAGRYFRQIHVTTRGRPGTRGSSSPYLREPANIGGMQCTNVVFMSSVAPNGSDRFHRESAPRDMDRAGMEFELVSHLPYRGIELACNGRKRMPGRHEFMD
jgi:hypothetical protein